MLINKITVGFVIQVFDTELNRFVSQEFTAGDDVAYEDQKGDAVDSALVMDKDGGGGVLAFPHGSAPTAQGRGISHHPCGSRACLA